MIYLIPIEPLPFAERYSVQWIKWFKREFEKQNIPYYLINPTPLSLHMEEGAFLDICGTNYYKAHQLALIAELFHKRVVKDGDIFFFHDLWFPGLEMLGYMRDGLGVRIKIVGCLHAGTYDKNDFVSQRGMGRWGKDLENSWFKIVDKVFVGSEYHRNLVCSERTIEGEKIVNTGFPIYWDELSEVSKENIVVFPHRLAPEKRPDLFDKLAELFKGEGWRFVKTIGLGFTKEGYYRFLGKAKIAVSFAEQETFGIAMREALFANCIPVVPDTLCYPEFFHYIFQYINNKDCVSLLRDSMEHFDTYTPYREENKRNLLELGARAIPNMLKELEL